MDFMSFVPYLIVMAGVTYLIRVIPFVLINKKIENRFINSFLYYIPYTVLSAMTFPASHRQHDFCRCRTPDCNIHRI